MKRIVLVFFMASFIAACSNTEQTSQHNKEVVVKKKKFNKGDYDKERKAIKTIEDSLIENSSPGNSKKLSEELLVKTIQFSNDYPNDPQTPDYLFMAARAANGLGQYHKSIDILNRIIRDYGNFDHLVEVYFLKAFTYDEDLKDKPNAKKSYLELIHNFPKDPMAEQAQMLLDNLYLSDKELMDKYNSQEKH